MRNCDLFNKVAQKMEEAGVVPMYLPPTRSVSSSTCKQYTLRFDFTQG